MKNNLKNNLMNNNYSSFNYYFNEIIFRKLRLSETYADMTAYTQIHDEVLHRVKYSVDTKLVKLQSLPDNGGCFICDKQAFKTLNIRLERARMLCAL